MCDGREVVRGVHRTRFLSLLLAHSPTSFLQTEPTGMITLGRIGAVIALLAATLISGPTHAAPPQTISYQGYLTSSSGTPVNSPPALSVVFSLYDVATGGTALWSETQSVMVVNGLYSVVLGNITQLTLPFNTQYYLGVKVGSDAEMTPRAALTMVPYAFRALAADTAATAGIASALSGAATIAGSQVTGAIANATIGGSQVTGALSNATLGNTALNQLDTRYIPLVGTARANLDNGGQIGWTSARLGNDGLPVVAYIDVTHNGLKVVKCGNFACSSGNTTTAVDSADPTSTVSLAVGGDGLPVISYRRNGLRVAKCGNAACASGNTLSLLDSGESHYSAVAVPASGIPVISYYSAASGDLNFVICGDAACSSPKGILTLDSTGDVGQFTSIGIGADGFPVISYYDATNFRPKVVKCGNATCTTRTVSMVGTAGTVKAGQYTSIAVPAGGLPVISYYDMDNGDLKVAKCADAACASALETAVDTAGNVGLNSSLALGADGLPVISYYDAANARVKTVKCGNADCSAGNVFSSVEAGPGTGPYAAVAVGQNGNPFIAYAAGAGLNLDVCQNTACAQANSTMIAASQITGSLTSATIDASRITGTVVGLQGPQGPAGAAGPQGAQGPAGSTGPQGPASPIAGLEIVKRDFVSIGTNLFGVPKYYAYGGVSCPAPKIVIAGGCFTPYDVNVPLRMSFPADTNSWSCRWNGNEDFGDNMSTQYAPSVYAVCVNP